MHHIQLMSMRAHPTPLTGVSGLFNGHIGTVTNAGGDPQFVAAVRKHCSSSCISITHTTFARDRWAELCNAIRHCNSKAQYLL